MFQKVKQSVDNHLIMIYNDDVSRNETIERRYQNIQTTIKYERKKKKISQSEMGELLGITGQGYGMKENGNRKFTPTQFLNVCRILDINPVDVIQDSIKM